VALKRALVTGITGQDGSYLAELLLDQGYEVHGLVRRVALEDPAHRLSRIAGILDRITLHAASLESFPSLYTAVAKVQPQELYHLAAQTFVSQSFEDAFSTFRSNIDGTHYILESVRLAAPECRVYYAGSSEMFGNALHSPQNEQTPFSPRSPYGVSKLTGFHLARNYREAYGMYVASGILFNHESPRRGYEFVTRKITSHAARIKIGLARELPLGNLEARRDWGYAPDYVRAMTLMLRRPVAEDLVVATGETHSVREFCEAAFTHLGLDYREYVRQHAQFYRPGEIHVLQGDASAAREKLGWRPSIGFAELVRAMVEHDLSMAQQG
jgi:GDPmannose 4,6-dehydratase